jgi:hypothetical protein
MKLKAADIMERVLDSIKAADEEARAADVAFAAGRFGEFFQREADAATRRIQDECDTILGKKSATGGSGEGG